MKRLLQLLLLILAAVVLNACKESGGSKTNIHKTDEITSENQNSVSDSWSMDTLHISGAPGRITRKIRKTANGGLLMASFNEVVVHKSGNFTALPKVPDLESVDVFDALEDRKGNIWVASTHHGLFRFDGTSYIRYTTDQGLAHNRTIDLFEDSAGKIWVATMGGLSCIDKGGIRNYTVEDGLPHNDVNCIMEDSKGRIWVGTAKWAAIKKEGSFITLRNSEGKAFSNVRSIIEDRHGNIWLGGIDGLWKYDGDSFTQVSKSFIAYILEDSKAYLWTSSPGVGSPNWQLSKYDNRLGANGNILLEEILTAEKMLFGINEDEQGNIWVGSLRGVIRYDGKWLSWVRGE